MDGFEIQRRVAAEALGTGMLVATVIGSGIMAEKLTNDTALALLCNTLPTGAVLAVLITILAPLSGAHLNPAVTGMFWLAGRHPAGEVLPYIVAQVVGGLVGAVVSHMMFALPLIDLSVKARTGPAQWFSEGVATFGLIVTIVAGLRFRHGAVPWIVGLYITAAYWFTASTSFANPAVAIARSISNTFAGIRPVDVPAFIVAQLAGASIAIFLLQWLLNSPSQTGSAASPEQEP
ncbi:MIP/aquaporin family protein [Prosthecomicrobium sp. N25]|uniref:MIP/aquaporin family protein n=1 Tax=Prosthecomicrobium sp. N25 TaxID=3129254 RepID=UPI003076F264